jgi:hypothetical protein
MIWRCATCGVETDFSAQRQHEQWHIDLDLRLDLMQSVIEALVKNQKRDPSPPSDWEDEEGDDVTDVTLGPPGRDRGQGVVSLFPES